MHHYKYDEELTPNSSTIPLKRGSWLHVLLEHHYRGRDWRRVMDRLLIPEWDRLFEEEKVLYGDLPGEVSRIMGAYEFHYRNIDRDFIVLEAEYGFDVELPHGHMMKVKIDLITEDEYGIWLWEHKSHKTFPGQNYQFLDIQTARYFYALQHGPDERYRNPIGVMWNYIKTSPPTVPKLTKAGKLSRARISTDVYTFVNAVREYGLNPNDYSDTIKVLSKSDEFFARKPVEKPDRVVRILTNEAVSVADEIERGYDPVRSIDRSCEYMCSYRSLCIAELYDSKPDLVRRTQYHKEDPFAYHRGENLT